MSDSLWHFREGLFPVFVCTRQIPSQTVLAVTLTKSCGLPPVSDIRIQLQIFLLLNTEICPNCVLGSSLPAKQVTEVLSERLLMLS